MAKAFAPKIIAANLLDTGLMAYLTADLTWSDTPSEAVVALDQDQFDAFAAATQSQMHIIAGIDPIDVSDVEARTPVRLRDKIRMNGPTTRPDLGAQAARPARAPLAQKELADVSL